VPSPTDRDVLKTIRAARKWVAHYKPFHKEPSCAKKLRSWRRKLKFALAEADARQLDVPPDPYAPPPPPPPPPTEEEVRAKHLAELRCDRFLADWSVCKGTTAWAAWGGSGWSAVTIITPARVWATAKRVDARSGEPVTEKTAHVRMDRLVRRDAALKGKDKPTLLPSEVFPQEDDDGEQEPAEPEATETRPPEIVDAVRKRLPKLMDLVGDDATIDDW